MFLRADAVRKFGKQRRQVFLLDEIYERTLKMCFERRYCMRFMDGVPRIEEISVGIDIYEDTHSLVTCVDPIGYRLRDRGYPGRDDLDIRLLCPEVTVDGKLLSKKLLIT